MELCISSCVIILHVVNKSKGWQWDWNIGSRYTIKRIVGNGSYGDVAEAIDTKSNESVGIQRFFHSVGRN